LKWKEEGGEVRGVIEIFEVEGGTWKVKGVNVIGDVAG
jgi:hypothetical protein